MKYFYRCTEEDGESWIIDLSNLSDARESIRFYQDLPPSYGEFRFEFFEKDEQAKTIRTLAKFIR